MNLKVSIVCVVTSPWNTRITGWIGTTQAHKDLGSFDPVQVRRKLQDMGFELVKDEVILGSKVQVWKARS